jgi:hypothetical protein
MNGQAESAPSFVKAPALAPPDNIAAHRTDPDPAPVRAKDVQVDKLFRAGCHRPGCGWTGTEYAAFADANAERQAHLNHHILGAPQ